MESIATPPEPQLDGSGLAIGVIVARYNWPVTGSMLRLAREEFSRLSVADEHITIAYAPGSYELATVAQAMLQGGSYDVLPCFGWVMRGVHRPDLWIIDPPAPSTHPT